jgi:twinkle protein
MMAQIIETLPDLLASAGIKLRHWNPGHTEQVVCVKCGGGKTRERSLSVSIDQDGWGAVWTCHRGSCGWTDGGRLHRDTIAPPGRVQRPTKPNPVPPSQQSHPDWMYRFFADRNIGARTVDAFGIYAAKHWFNPEWPDHDAIVFPYRHQDELVNRKYRPFPEKQPQAQDKNALQTLFNVDRLGEAPQEVLFVEGEPDVLALYECGLHNAVSLKDGAPAIGNAEHEKRYEALRTHGEMLAKVKRFVLAGDMDLPGLALREELARRLGRHRCWLVTWPGGHKDACDVLRSMGPQAVLDAIGHAEPYPIDGIQRIGPGTLTARRNLPRPEVMTTGTIASDAVLAFPTEGRLIAISGYPGGGKTAWLRFVMIHTARSHERRWAVFSPEMQPWEDYAVECAEVLIGRPFWPGRGHDGMNDEEIQTAERWLANRVSMLVCDAEDQAPTLDWILERARAVVLRDGVTDLLIDPWNEVDHDRSDRITETDYIGRALQRLKAFGLRHGCNVWIVVHPSKPFGIKPGERKPPPGPYDCAASAHWANKPDLGVTVHSDELGTAQIHVWKTRFRRFGMRGQMATVEYNDVTGRYRDPPEILSD